MPAPISPQPTTPTRSMHPPVVLSTCARVLRPTWLVVRPPDTADRLRAAAFDLFSSQGFDATTVDDIAQHARVGRTTFFRHFRTKEDVVFPDHPGLVAAVRSEEHTSELQ